MWSHVGEAQASIPSGDMHYLRDPYEAVIDFKEYRDALASTLEIRTHCNFCLEPTEPFVPRSPLIEEGESATQALRRLCAAGLATRYGDSVSEQVIERLEFELKQLCSESGTPEYLLVVAEYVGWAKSEGIECSPGRGSSAGSLVNYLLGITEIDPLKYGLLFERMGRSEGNGLPDIDVDFSLDGVARVRGHIEEVSRTDALSVGCRFAERASQAFRDACSVSGRVVGLSEEMTAGAKDAMRAVVSPGAKLSEALVSDGTLRNLWYSNWNIRHVFETALAFEGLVRGVGTHACAIALCPDMAMLPCGVCPDYTTWQTQYSAVEVERYGALKLDLLGLRTLDVISCCKELVAASGAEPFEPIDSNDGVDALRRLLVDGDLGGVFLFQDLDESLLGAAVSANLSSIKDVAAFLALYRPGPLEMGWLDEFASGGVVAKERVADVLSDSRGVLIYDEQVIMNHPSKGWFAQGL